MKYGHIIKNGSMREGMLFRGIMYEFWRLGVSLLILDISMHVLVNQFVLVIEF